MQMQNRLQRRKLPLRSAYLYGSPERDSKKGGKTALLVEGQQNEAIPISNRDKKRNKCNTKRVAAA